MADEYRFDFDPADQEAIQAFCVECYNSKDRDRLRAASDYVLPENKCVIDTWNARFDHKRKLTDEEYIRDVRAPASMSRTAMLELIRLVGRERFDADFIKGDRWKHWVVLDAPRDEVDPNVPPKDDKDPGDDPSHDEPLKRKRGRPRKNK